MQTTALLASSTSVVDTAKAMKVRNDSKVKAMPEMFARHSRTANSFEFGKQTDHTVKNVFGNKARQITKLVKCKSTANISIDLDNLNVKDIANRILYFRGYHATDALYNETLAANKRKGETCVTTTGEKYKHKGTNIVAVNVRFTLPHWKLSDGKQLWININTLTIKRVHQYSAMRVKDRTGYEIYDIFIDSADLRKIEQQIINADIAIKQHTLMT